MFSGPPRNPENYSRLGAVAGDRRAGEPIATISKQSNSASDKSVMALRLETYVDHTVLRPEASAAQIDQLCDEALEHCFAAVCVNPVWVSRCAKRLAIGGAGGPVVCTVAGFPLGASVSEIKAAEARKAVEEGALEVDLVVNMGALISGERSIVTADIAATVAETKRVSVEDEACRRSETTTKWATRPNQGHCLPKFERRFARSCKSTTPS